MDNGFKTVQHRTADAGGGAFRQPESGMRGFQRFEFTEQAVVFGIGHAGRIERVILAGVAV